MRCQDCSEEFSKFMSPFTFVVNQGRCVELQADISTTGRLLFCLQSKDSYSHANTASCQVHVGTGDGRLGRSAFPCDLYHRRLTAFAALLDWFQPDLAFQSLAHASGYQVSRTALIRTLWRYFGNNRGSGVNISDD